MPTNATSGIHRLVVMSLVALLVLPPGAPVAFARKKKKADMRAANESELTQDQRALHALNRLTFGPRPGDVAAVEAMGLDKWINEQLNPETIDDAALETRLAAYPAMRMSRHDLIERFPSPAMIRQAEQGKRGLPWNPVERAIYQDQIAQLQRAAGEQEPERRSQVSEHRAGCGDEHRARGTGDNDGHRAQGTGHRGRYRGNAKGDRGRYGSATSAGHDAGGRCSERLPSRRSRSRKKSCMRIWMRRTS